MQIVQDIIPKGYQIKKGLYWGKMSLSYAYEERRRLMRFNNIKNKEAFLILRHANGQAEILEKA